MDSEHRRQSEPEEVYQSVGEVALVPILKMAGKPRPEAVLIPEVNVD
jgi:hypothetical protein